MSFGTYSHSGASCTEPVLSLIMYEQGSYTLEDDSLAARCLTPNSYLIKDNLYEHNYKTSCGRLYDVERNGLKYTVTIYEEKRDGTPNELSTLIDI